MNAKGLIKLCEAIEINHAEYQKKVKTMSDDQLHYIIKDAGDAMRANPEGEKAGYYQDEIHYASMELKRREDIKKGLIRS